ncbi:hypothetical protein [Nannocystis sp.]|uniref:hypothetical protein n=1 Tax=Nannocystis sp. TaxID=1962667 RepID=UPI0025D9E39D|nr:hypothetical protein [Nannocystis sp.]MBK7827081.1 hypothetical protein [Nannocystis sp.]
MSQPRLIFSLTLATLLACTGGPIADPSGTDATTDADTGTTSSVPTTGSMTGSTTDSTTGSMTDSPTGSTGDSASSTGDTTTGAPDPACGDDNQDPGEECDNGAGNADDQACTAGCTVNVCGDGLQGPGEGCDDGNDLDDDGCSSECSLPDCGDGRLGGGEACDDGNADNTDSCTDACTAAVCGDSFIQPANGETCDNGAQNADSNACTAGCALNVCGDGKLGPGEGCDDGNVLDGDDCSSACSSPDCGDGLVGGGEACDDGNDINTDKCTDTCTAAVCGDGFIQPSNTETCDDGVNNKADAACTPKCLKATCGDGYTLAGVEQCDNGDQNADNNACIPGCKLNVCGDGKKGPGELCDDGNLIDDDECSNTCEGPPEAAVLKLNFSQVKQFDFSWAAANGATFYRLLERPTPNASYAQLGADIVGTSTSRTMPLHLRFGASYILKACNDKGCTDSAAVDVVDSMAKAVGYFKASNTEGDSFGSTVALSADGQTLAVGAYTEDSAATGIDGDQSDNSAANAGAAYVFVKVGGAWSQQAYIKASNTGTLDRFGGDFWSNNIALSADGNTLVVTAYAEDSGATGVGGDQGSDAATESGAVYVFNRVNTAWSQQAYIKASNTGAKDYFGWSATLSADGDTLAIGATGEDSGATGINGDQGDNSVAGAGAVYLFVRANGAWSQQAYIKPSSTGKGYNFGGSVALSGDGNTLAVGAVGQSGVYVFVRANNVWSQQAHVKASNAESGDVFGQSVALSTDGNTLAVGACYEDSAATGVDGDQANNNAMDSGAAYVFVRANNVWSQQAYVKASNTGANDWFGWALRLSADGNMLAVGAYNEDSAAAGVGGDQANNAATSAGAVYVFVRANDIWSQRAYVKASNPATNDKYGTALALSGDGRLLVAGAPSEASAAVGIGGDQADNSVAFAGAVYLY